MDFVARSRSLRQAYIITSHSKLPDVITYPCLRYLLLTPKSSYIPDHHSCIIIHTSVKRIFLKWYSHIRGFMMIKSHYTVFHVSGPPCVMSWDFSVLQASHSNFDAYFLIGGFFSQRARNNIPVISAIHNAITWPITKLASGNESKEELQLLAPSQCYEFINIKNTLKMSAEWGL